MDTIETKIKEAEDRIMWFQKENGFSTIFDQLNEDLEAIRRAVDRSAIERYRSAWTFLNTDYDGESTTLAVRDKLIRIASGRDKIYDESNNSGG